MRFAGIGTIVVLLLLFAVPATAGAAPTCEEGPQIVGSTYFGTPCPDVIRAPRAVTTIRGEGGDDALYGQRGNDTLLGGEGNDRLYGGVGDDQAMGGPGNDLMAGGFGDDSLDGQSGDDFVRGDATIDRLGDTGGGTDTLSFATGATPGFPNTGSFFTEAGFPPGAEGRGVFVDLGEDFANNGQAPSGGGVDRPLVPATDFSSFEIVIGTPFPDYIVGTGDAETFYGGGGADLIDGGGGGDVARGGAGEDGCVEVTTDDCESSEEEIGLGDPGAIAVGIMAPQAGGSPGLYLTGSEHDDVVTATFANSSVTFELGPASGGAFDPDPTSTGGCDPAAGDKVVCHTTATPDSIVLAGMEGNDTLTASELPETVSAVLLGGQDGDVLTGGETEDAVIDGSGADTVSAGGRDDAVPNNGGTDNLHAGAGEDLFISNAVCEGDVIDGGPDRDNANWANFNQAIVIDMVARIAGRAQAGGQLTCSGEGAPTTLEAIEDVESTGGADVLLGDDGPNQLLGRQGADSYFAAGGNDSILANSGDSDPVIDCGEGWDTALIDIPTHTATEDFEDAPPIACEDIEERPPNSFRPPGIPPNPNPPVAEPSNAPALVPKAQKRRRPDVKAPQTRIVSHPRAMTWTARRTRRVAFRFAANEAATGFRCRLDRGSYRSCSSPRRYRVRTGPHTFRVYGIDAAGNRDRSPALFAFRVRRR